MDIREIIRRMIRKYITDDTEFLSITIQKDGSGSISREEYNSLLGQIVLSWESLQELIARLETQDEIRD